MAASKKTFDEMLRLYRQGTTRCRLAEIYGISLATVGLRLKRLGCVRPVRRLDSIVPAVDKKRLTALYTDERLSYQRIAAELGISVKALRLALKFHGIPKRPTAYWGGRYLERLRKLQIGETTEITYRDQTQIATLRQTARQLGILISIRLLDGNAISVTRISEDEARRLSDIGSINRGQLAELYSEQKLSAEYIGRHFGFSTDTIKQALDFYAIPRRVRGGRFGGKYTSVFQKLKVGEASEVECAAKYPYTNLHSIAARIGMKISMRRISSQRYEITRLA